MEIKENTTIIATEAIKARISEILQCIGVEGMVEEGVVGDTTTFTIRTQEAGLLIGEDGQSLMALNYIVRKIIEKEAREDTPMFLVDVNDYQRRRYEELRDRARMGAQRVRYFKKEVALQPMSAFDRRVIHLALQEYPDIITESTGVGHERRVVIKPYS